MPKFWNVRLSRPTADGGHKEFGRDHIRAETSEDLVREIRQRWPEWAKNEDCVITFHDK